MRSSLLLAMLLVVKSLAFAILPEPKIRHYSISDGLSHDGISCITEDSEGFMWFGSWDGINRYDGSNFVTYKAKPGDNSSLKSNRVKDIVEDKLGYLWVQTYDRKVYRFDKAREEFKPLPKSANGEDLENLFIQEIIPVSNGDVWLITLTNDVVCVSSKRDGSMEAIHDNSPNSILGNANVNVNFVFEDSHKRIWIGTNNGLICLVKIKNRYVSHFARRTEPYGGNFNFTHASSDSTGKLFFGTSNGLLVEYKSGLKTFLSRRAVNGAINDILVSKTGKVYITSTDPELTVYNTQESRFYRHNTEGASFLSMYEDRSGNIWLEPKDEGVVLYKPSNNTFHPLKNHHPTGNDLPYVIRNRLGNDLDFNVFEDVNNLVWICLKKGGFGYYSNSENKINYLYGNTEGKDKVFSNRSIIRVYSDKKGIIWYCTANGGVNKAIFSPNNFEYKQLVANSSNEFENQVRALFQDSDGKIWITSKSGKLYIYKNKSIAVIDNGQNLGSIYCITEDRKKNVWIGTKGQGLIKLIPDNDDRTKYSIVRYKNDPYDLNSISNNQIYSVVEDRGGRLWIGTFGDGLNLLIEQDGKAMFKNPNNSFKNYPPRLFRVIRHLRQGPDGNIWIATTNGLLRFDPNADPDHMEFAQTVKIPGDRHSLGNNDVQYLYVSSGNEVWIGTFGGGLNRVVNKPSNINETLKFKVYTRDQGLPNDIVLSLVEDNDRNLWIATENGISKLDVRTETFRNYDFYDGLPQTGLSEAACFRSDKGEIFFGGINGYISFDPGKIINERFTANMVFTGIQLHNEDLNTKDLDSPLPLSINYAKNITFEHNQNVITLEYGVLDYRVTDNISYAYILERYDQNWHYVKNQRKATYTKIPPGDYVFRVKTVDNYYFDNTPEKSIAIKIKNPWWLTRWAIFCYVLLFVTGLEIARRIALTMIRLKNKVIVEERMAELKMQFFTNISHELRTPLTLIVNPLHKIRDMEHLSDTGNKYLGVANKNVDRMIRFVNQLLDFRKIQNQNLKLRIELVELVAFLSNILEHYVDILEEKEITLELISSAEEIFVWCDRDKMDIVFFNIISNAIKFTQKKKKISVAIDKKEKLVTVKVVDEGIGICESQINDIFKPYYEGGNQQDKTFKGTGIGLALAKDIVNLHKGSIRASRNEGEGMTFTVSLSTGNLHFSPSEIWDKNNWTKEEYKKFALKKGGVRKGEVAEEDRKNLPKLLLVEDNRELREFILDQFKGIYNVYEAENGQEGYLKAVELIPDTIISDVMMPELDGIAMLEKLKKTVATSHIPIILLTAKSAVEDQIKGLSYGADFYLTKPFHADYVKYLLENLLKNRQKLVANILDKPTILKLEPTEVIITSMDGKFLRDVIHTIEGKITDSEFSIDSVANSMAMGRTTFYKKLKSLTNMSPVEFVKDIRLKRAKQLLDTAEFSVTEVAYQIGFNSSGYFSTCFKGKYKVSPSDYLKMAQKQSY